MLPRKSFKFTPCHCVTRETKRTTQSPWPLQTKETAARGQDTGAFDVNRQIENLEAKRPENVTNLNKNMLLQHITTVYSHNIETIYRSQCYNATNSNCLKNKWQLTSPISLLSILKKYSSHRTCRLPAKTFSKFQWKEHYFLVTLGQCAFQVGTYNSFHGTLIPATLKVKLLFNLFSGNFVNFKCIINIYIVRAFKCFKLS